MQKIKFSKLMVLVLVLVMMFSLVGCGSNNSTVKDGPTISVASKPWTEQLILGNILIQYLEANGYPVEDRTGLGETPVIRPALHSGEVDIYWEYTGTTLVNQMGEEKITESQEAYDKVKAWDKEENNVIWLDYGTANNTYALMMRDENAQELNIETMSDLSDYINDGGNLKFASGLNFLERPDGLPGIQKAYGFQFEEENIITMAEGLTHGALKDEQVDVAMGFATDGRIAAFNLRALEDDKLFFPVYNVAPVIRQEVLDEYPELVELLNKISPLLDNEMLIEMNKKVDVDEREPEDVAKEFLVNNGLIEE
ncbi:glycine betaine ABC transporter substrate-binding protein [Schnuerera sp.]|uniref:ABC transporter substrate-binding protein n=1 Tax=Schnuerera sp. TaxID=2794844 RepID=UPI002C77A9CB|nr:glycine betaine ABC transporter substrate-binding protein [Schnuerera sp.]HSH35372.1 glycine betaine ABC transporter substrate-binding protein [Schnuerera sp.]